MSGTTMPIGSIIAMALYGKMAFAYSKTCVKRALKNRQNKDLNDRHEKVQD